MALNRVTRIKYNPNGFDLVHTDPPWRYKDASRQRGGAARWYDTMSIDELKQINVADVCKKDAYLFMWTTGPQLDDSIDLLKAWGFRYSTIGFVWVKRTKNHYQNVSLRMRRAFRATFGANKMVPVRAVLAFMNGELVQSTSKDRWHWGMGSHTRACAEIVLIGLRGKPKRASKGIHQVLEELVAEHSVKPEEVYRRLEEFMGPNALMLDMFTRKNRARWAALGDQVERTDFIIDAETYRLIDVRPEQQRIINEGVTNNEQQGINQAGIDRLESKIECTEGRPATAVCKQNKLITTPREAIYD